MRPLLICLLFLLPVSAQAAVIGGPLVRDGVEVVPSIESGIQFDKPPVTITQDSVFVIADVSASRNNAYGITGFIPYLSISFSLTKDGQVTFKKTGLLYPTASKSGPRYVGVAQFGGPGTYKLTYIISPPSAHGMYRQTENNTGVPEWWKPIIVSWEFSYPIAKNTIGTK